MGEAGRDFLEVKTGTRGFGGAGAMVGGVGVQPGRGAEEDDPAVKEAMVYVVSNRDGASEGRVEALDRMFFQRVQKGSTLAGEWWLRETESHRCSLRPARWLL